MATNVNTLEQDLKIAEFLLKWSHPNICEIEKVFYFNEIRRGNIQIETVVENAMSFVGYFLRIAEFYRDFDDDSDAKKAVSQNRYCGGKKYPVIRNSFMITSIATKVGTLRCFCYNKLSDSFHFYKIPNEAYQGIKTIEIILEQYKDDGIRTLEESTGISNYSGKWNQYEVKTFEEVCSK